VQKNKYFIESLFIYSTVITLLVCGRAIIIIITLGYCPIAGFFMNSISFGWIINRKINGAILCKYIQY